MALEKSQGNLGAAVEALRKYVDVFQTDREAWEELGSLYLQARPALCYVLCLRPANMFPFLVVKADHAPLKAA